MNVGFHLKISKGLSHAAMEARDTGLRAYQYFAKNPRSLQVTAFDPAEAKKCKQINQEHHIQSIVHAAYPINLATEGEKSLQVMASLLHDLTVAEACGSIGVIVHFGHYRSTNKLKGYINMLECLNQVLHNWQGQAKVFIENLAHGPMGTTIEEMLHIRELSEHKDKIGFCLDTCHAFASGLWPNSDDAQRQWQDSLAESGYLEHVGVLHLNDSKGKWGSGKDLHANIGQGQIGAKRIQNFLQFYRQYAPNCMIIMETPNGKSAQLRRVEWDALQQLL